ncbi:putative polyketide synthase [Xylariaceae sp. FL1019]|nr:putative polyketide synthase [Xylariaceae sp. FL1019]
MEPNPRASRKPRFEIDEDAIAICGFSLKFPGDAITAESFWQMMADKRCAATDFPRDRFKGTSFYDEKGGVNTIRAPGGHFIRESLAAFDADFFSISSMEACSIDPMQRWLLETAFRALENAGITMESIAGSATSVYTGSFGLDYGVQINRDAESPPAQAGLGFGISFLANRLSWFFDLRGPSVGLDSACSSSAMSIDMACQALRSGACTMSMVAGCNLTFAPETFTWLSNLHFLSPDGRCYSFDHRANGYARGEGIGVIILKKVADAIRDGNTIRAVIRSTLSNEDGRTPGITQPSSYSQESLIRETYRRAGLSMEPTRYFEAHGTGTAIGDPCEARAIGSSFAHIRSSSDPIFVGAVKSNIGHLEGASGIAAVIKTVLVLERGIIPPNANFEQLNPKIDAEGWGIKFPAECCSWPSPGLRRASINSFGYGGANCHIILDDAYHYLSSRCLTAQHCTQFMSDGVNGSAHFRPLEGTNTERADMHGAARSTKLLAWSSADKGGLDRIAQLFQGIKRDAPLQSLAWEGWLGNLAYTLDSRRTHLRWRSFALVNAACEFADIRAHMSSPVRANLEAPPRIGFVFSGQGAQWAGMGQELLQYSSYATELQHAGKFLRGLGCSWSVTDELVKSDASRLDDPKLSQTLCTVVQVALVNLLERFGVRPKGVVGHSSGEIAAAYAGGYISLESCWKLAYLRGVCCSRLLASSPAPIKGAMISVGIDEQEAAGILSLFNSQNSHFGAAIACVNSPRNVTISGEESTINMIFQHLQKQGTFVRRLRVPLAYHSPQMRAIADEYTHMISTLDEGCRERIPMISSVTGEPATLGQLIDPSYWALNLVSTVRFSEAIGVLCAQSAVGLVKKIDLSHHDACVVDHLLELGPHATLQGPIRQTLQSAPRGSSITYGAALRRGCSASMTLLSCLGNLFNLGVKVDLRAANEPGADSEQAPARKLLVDLPEYPFDHSQTYWHESRLSRNYRFREYGPSKYLGVRARDWDPAEPRWRLFIKPDTDPWVAQHVVNGVNLYPGAGMLVMAVEAVSQLARDANRPVRGYNLQDIHFEAAMDLSMGQFEVQTRLHRLPSSAEDQLMYWFSIRSFVHERWTTNCHGIVSAEPDDETDDWTAQGAEKRREDMVQDATIMQQNCARRIDSCEMYNYLKDRGLSYGPFFQVAQNQSHSGSGQATATFMPLNIEGDGDGKTQRHHVVHPITLDGLMHLCFTALTAGGTRAMATSVPSHVRSMWVSNNGLSGPGSTSLLAVSDITDIEQRGFACNGIGIDNDGSGKIRIWYEGLAMTNLGVASKPLTSPDQHFCMTIDRKISLNTLDNGQIVAVLHDAQPRDETPTSFFADLELVILEALSALDDPRNLGGVASPEPWVEHYLRWARYHLDRTGRRAPKDAGFDDVCHRVNQANPVGRLYTTVARNLVSLVRGEMSALELLVQGHLLKDYYEVLTNYRCANMISHYLDLLAHQKAGMNILEVGGGTGSGTRKFVRALCTHPGTPETSFLRCGRYDFTDVSPAFLDAARKEFRPWEAQMSFGTLDIERAFAEQGYRNGGYDVVLAVSVLHITRDLMQTLLNVRSSLKPGGKLVIQESFKRDGWTLGFVFGVFPGWWLGASDDGRLLSPNLALEEWDALLKETGFSGNDLVFHDFQEDVARNYGWIVSTAVDATTSEIVPDNTAISKDPISNHVQIIINPVSHDQRELAGQLEVSLSREPGVSVTVDGALSKLSRLDDMKTNSLRILLVEYGAPFLANMTRERWEWMQGCFRGTGHYLWISSGGGQLADPRYGMVGGLARTLRSELPGLHLVTLALDGASKDPGRKTNLIMSIAAEMMQWVPFSSYEEEYIQVDGALHTERLVEANHITTSLQASLAPFRVSPLPLDRDTRFALQLDRKEVMGRTRFVTAEPLSSRCVGQDDVDVSVRSSSLQSWGGSRDAHRGGGMRQTACAGVVLRAGSASGFGIGDRVFIRCDGLPVNILESQVRVASEHVVKMDPAITFSQCCGYAPPRLVAFDMLCGIAQVRRTDKILIHRSLTPTGLCAVRLAMERGVGDVWATAADGTERVLLVQATGLSEDRILPVSWFENSPMLASHWKGRFDVIFSNQAGAKESPLMHYVAPTGRYVVCNSPAGGRDSPWTFKSHSSSFMSKVQTPRDLKHSRDALEYACDPSHISAIRTGEMPPIEFCASDVDKAIERLASASVEETVVVNFNRSDIIEVAIPSGEHPSFRDDVTYVVSGGLGGLGRAIARWLVARGARNLILLSRSGARSQEARELVDELTAKNVQCETPRCDVTDRFCLREVLVACHGRLPPIRGCIQVAMVMTESVFHRMTFDKWADAVAPKVQASWNLHCELPRGLDFFVMLSSVMGILGTGSLAGYNAGNTYEDSLARYRVVSGEHGVALDIGGVVDGGYLTELDKFIQGMQRSNEYVPLLTSDVCGLLEVCCSASAEEVRSGQVVLGVRPPAHWKGGQVMPEMMRQPLWGHMHSIPLPKGQGQVGASVSGEGETAPAHERDKLLALVTNGLLSEAGEAACQTLVDRVSVMLGTPAERIDKHKSMHAYGIDSMSAIDLRSWVGDMFHVDLPVFEILGGADFISAGQSLVRRMTK